MKRNKLYFIVAIATLALGLILMFISACINGFNLNEWLHDEKTITGIVLAVVMLIFMGLMILKKKVSEL